MNTGTDMAIEARDILTGAEWLIAGGTLMTAIVVGIRKVYRMARNVEESLALVNRVNAQLTPNGGSSLHDKITALDAKVDDNQRLASQAVEDLRDVHERLGRLESVAMNRRKEESGS